ncbi:MAG: NAD(+)/NADH kinase [Bacteroidales bacterium]|nr:NAD(+)/NADH kinase [Bacteroidales bacterium]
MRIATYLRNYRIENDDRLSALLSALEAEGCDVHRVFAPEDIADDTDFLLSIGGDGTFLSAAKLVGDRGIPVLGVNLGRLGFLSENRPDAVAEALVSGEYTIENRTLLKASLSRVTGSGDVDGWPFALNEMTVHRSGAAMLGVDVSIDGVLLPTYWADGLLVATSSGSTAYSLSVGGPIVLPESKVLIISPIASHNLNVRPLVVPDTSEISISLRSRDRKVMLTMDNRTVEIDRDMEMTVSMAQFSLRRVRLNSSNFINALTGKLFWGEDIRNSTEH